MASALHALGRYDESIVANRAALTIEPENLTALVNLAQAQQESGDPDAAVETFERVLAVRPDHVNALANMAIALQEAGRRDEAAKTYDFERLVQIRPAAVPDGYPDMAAFVEDLKRYIYGHPTLVWDRPAKSTTKGSQTLELLTGDDPAAHALEQVLRGAVQAYIDDFLTAPDGPYRGAVPTHWRIVSWAVVLRSGGHQLPHVHPSGFASGIFYVNLPDAVGRDEGGAAGCVRFGPSRMGGPAGESQQDFLRRTVTPELGLTVLFPSYFWHHTVPFESEEHRICVAFDAVPN